MHHTYRILEYFFSFRWKIDSSHLNRINLNVFKILSLCWRWFVWECKKTLPLLPSCLINELTYRGIEISIAMMPAKNRRNDATMEQLPPLYIRVEVCMRKWACLNTTSLCKTIVMTVNIYDFSILIFDTVDSVLRIF